MDDDADVASQDKLRVGNIAMTVQIDWKPLAFANALMNTSRSILKYRK